MDFDLSKENIQPLRGGRNVTHLGVALQAQNDSEFHKELLEQKRKFEEIIRTYEGDDPLDNWYNYIYWVEQSYPKHGHEGNLVPILEDCLSKFENDERYIHDRRFCKLWIKYIDLQKNPLELFQLLYSKGICASCADLYRAWAFYHEISGDYKKADTIFQLGLSNLAQPVEDLSLAQKNMYMAIGKEAIQGIDEGRREEVRHALTSLVSYKQHQRTVVPSVRIGSNVLNNTPGLLKTVGSQDRRNNVPVTNVTLYEDLEVAGPSIGASLTVSVLDVARKQEIVHKENALKPGTWKKIINTKHVLQHRQPSFTVHEDENPLMNEGIRLPRDFAPMNHDVYSDWKTEVCYLEPHDDTKIPMYPKNLVYSTPNQEFSPEEIKAEKWILKQQAIQNNIIENNDESMEELMMEEANIVTENSNNQPLKTTEVEQAVQSILHTTNNHLINSSQKLESPKMNPVNYPNPCLSPVFPHIPFKHPVSVSESQDIFIVPQQTISNANVTYSQNMNPETSKHCINNYTSGGAASQVLTWPNNSQISDCTQNMREAMKDINDIWKESLATDIPEVQVKKSEISKFQIYEDTKLQEEMHTDKPVTSATFHSSNNLHFTIHEDKPPEKMIPLTGTFDTAKKSTVSNKKILRESIQTQFCSQQSPEIDYELPRKTSSHLESLLENKFATSAIKLKMNTFESSKPDFNETCTTQLFNFHLKHVSTPKHPKKIALDQFAESIENDAVKASSQKCLFDDVEKNKEESHQQQKLSVILETTKEYRSSSSGSLSSVATFKTTTFQPEQLKAIPEGSRTHSSLTIDDNKSVIEIHQRNNTLQKLEHSDVQNYKVVKKFLQDTSQTPHIINLIDDDSIIKHTSNQVTNNYESPMKNQFREMTCDSNDSSNSLPAKVHKMDVDCVSNQNSNSLFRIENEFIGESDETILQQPPNDPFQSKLIDALLRKVHFPNPKYSNQYFQIQHLPRSISKKDTIYLKEEKFTIEKTIGKGAFGCVYKAINKTNGQLVALKYQKPPNKWEFYIIKEIRERLTNPHMLSAFMDVMACYVAPTATILVSEFFKYGSLLDMTNKVKKATGKSLKENVAIYYASEIITIINCLHQCKIIHADIKPDNFMITRLPPEFGYPSLQLIDFGCSIDMSLFPEGTTFRSSVNTENFICTEMKDGRPWTYQTDIFCVAATIHVLLFNKYMQLQKNGSIWEITQTIPRYMRADLWRTFFFQMLNIDGCHKLPDLNQIKDTFQLHISAYSEELHKELRAVANIIMGR